MICSSCQAENRDVARFCVRCGKPLVRRLAEQAPAEGGMIVPSPLAETPKAALGHAPEGLAAIDARIEEAHSLSSAQALPPAAGDKEAATPPVAPAPAADATRGETDFRVPVPVGDASASTAAAPQAADETASATMLSDRSAPAPLTPGAVIAGRFEIVRLLATQAGVNLYAASDLAACPACGFAGNSPEDAYCVECGVERRGAGAPVACQIREALSLEALGARGEDGFTQGDRFYLLAPAAPDAAPGAADAQAAAPGMLVLAVGYASHVGMERALDEDSICVFTLSGVYESVADPTLGLFIVADGMGGHEGGEVASKLAVQRIAEQLIKRVLLPRFTGKSQATGDFVRQLLRKAIADANKEIHDLAQQRANDMGCTLTLAMVLDGTAYIANVGDSRTYIQRAGRLRQVTTDHSLVASLVAAGVIQPDEIFTHPERSVIYRSLGTNASMEVDLFTESLAPGDVLVVCCDGLWEAIRDEGIEDVLLTHPDPQAACAELVRQANLAGGEDNISVIIVKVQKVSASDLVP